MRQLTIREARRAISHLDRLFAEESEVTITRRGEPVARLVAICGRKAIPSHRDLREAMPRMRRGSERLIREDRDAS
jgi:prevent-host-death family protein